MGKAFYAITFKDGTRWNRTWNSSQMKKMCSLKLSAPCNRTPCKRDPVYFWWYFVFTNYPVVVVKSIRMIKMFTINVSTEAYNLIVWSCQISCSDLWDNMKLLIQVIDVGSIAKRCVNSLRGWTKDWVQNCVLRRNWDDESTFFVPNNPV